MNENVYKKRKRMLRCLLLVGAMLCSVFAGAETSGQHKGLAVQRLEDFIKSLEKQYKISFVYDASQINKASMIEADRNASPLENALKQLLANGITYKIIDNRVILKKAETVSQPKDIVVRGTVTVKTQTGTETMPGVYILEKGTKNGTATGPNGEYSIRVQNGASLVFSMIGYKNQEIAVDGRTTVNVTLEEDISTLQEVVVTGYQNIDRKLFTGSAVKLNAKDVQRNGVPDISRMLEGQVAGVAVQNVSGTFGAAPKIRIRGATSITGDNKPLWVVDGIVLEDVVNISNEQLSTGDPNTLIGSSVAGLNPDDIESFNILKDAAATAMYGARAMNGVIVVTTKKGRRTEGKPLISYTGNFTTYLKPTYDQFDILNSADQMSVYLEMQNKGFFNHSDISRAENGGVFHKMYNQMYVVNDAENSSFGLRNDLQSRLAYLQRYANANTNWFDILFDNSLLQEHSLSINTGTEKAQLYASTSFLNDNGWSKGDHVKRFTGNIRGSFNINDKLSLELITQGSVRDQRAPGTLERESNAVYGEYSRDFDINPYSYALNTSRTMTAYDENGNLEFFTRNYAPFNILHELNYNTMELSMIDFKVQGGLKYRFLKGFSYSFDGAYRYAKTDREHKIHENSNMPEAYRTAYDATIRERNRFLYSDPDNPNDLPAIVLPAGGFYNVTSDNLVNYYLRNNIEWDTQFNTDHRLNVFGSVEMRYSDRQNRSSDGVGYQYERGGVPFIDPRYIKWTTEGGFPYYGMRYNYDRFIAYMTRAAYSYNGKYSINGTVRYDGSNLLGESRKARWLPTWNISGAWDIDEEKFFSSQKILTSARLRATYGLVGSLGAANNSSLVLNNRSTRRPYLSETETAMIISGLENSELTWEKLYETNIGADLGFLDDRINLTVDVYKRNIFDLIGQFRTSGIGGQATKLANYGDMEGKGIETTIGAAIIKSNDLNWRSQLNFAYNKNTITNLDNHPNIWNLIGPDGGARLGFPHRGLFSVQFAGLDPLNGYPMFIDVDGEIATDVYFQSEEIDYLKYEGPVDPRFTGGFYNAVGFKNFSLSALLTFAWGNKIRLDPHFSQNWSDMDAMSKDYLRRWVMPGDEEFTNIPALVDPFINASTINSTYPFNTYNYSTETVAKGDFVRLKQISLSYQLPVKLLSRYGFTNSSLSVVGNNIALLYSDKRLNGQDPEFFGSGGVALPIPRQYTLSLKLGF